MSRTAKSQVEHDRIVQQTVNYVAQEGDRNIRADLPGHTQPELVEGTQQDHIPDVTADGVIVEVETGDTIEGDNTTSQWSLFSDHAAKNGMTFWVVVPNGSVAAAQARLNALGLVGEVYGA